MVIKGQVLADFIIEFMTQPKEIEEKELTNVRKWELYVDGSLNDNGAGAGLMLINLEGHKVHSSPRFGLKASNNEAEYDALISGLKLAKELKAKVVHVFSDS